MSEEKTAITTAGKGGWLKAIVGTVAGLFSGAVMMYLTPLVERVVKPAKPLANFAVEQQSLAVTFHNRSNGGEGWWDFGDGSPLEPVSPKQPSVTHSYANPGTYTAKMSIHNFVGEENERAVNLQIDTTKSTPPTVEAFEVSPLSPANYAPATFRVSCKIKNAQLCVWDFGDDRPFQFETDVTGSQDRLVTFTKAGGYVIKLAAVNGKEALQKSEIVYVDEPPKGALTAILNVSEQGTRVQKLETPVTVAESFNPQTKGSTQAINRQVPARQGYEITDARLEPVSGKGGKDLHVQVAADRRSVTLTGELIKESGSLLQRHTTASNLVVKIVMMQERRTHVSRPPIPVTATLSAPGSAVMTLPPTPPDWTDVQRQLRLELRDGDRVVYQESQLPHNAAIALGARRCALNATPLSSQVRVELAELRPGQNPNAN